MASSKNLSNRFEIVRLSKSRFDWLKLLHRLRRFVLVILGIVLQNHSDVTVTNRSNRFHDSIDHWTGFKRFSKVLQDWNIPKLRPTDSMLRNSLKLFNYSSTCIQESQISEHSWLILQHFSISDVARQVLFFFFFILFFPFVAFLKVYRSLSSSLQDPRPFMQHRNENWTLKKSQRINKIIKINRHGSQF